MTFTVYVAPEAVRDFQNWLIDHADEPSQWLNCRVKLVTPATPGWVAINITNNQWCNLHDWFGLETLTP